MLLRTILYCAALILALLLSLNADAGPADAEPCEAAACPAASAPHPSKPLDIMQFMREQAASTRTAAAHATIKPRGGGGHPVAQRQKPVAAKSKSMPSEAAASFAAQPAAAPAVEVVAADEINAIDRAGEAAPPETVGAPPPTEPPVQVVEADTVNAIDLAGETAPPPAPVAAQLAVPQASERVSWVQWLWSAVENTFAALAEAVHHLIG
jgi:hypothetical protein